MHRINLTRRALLAVSALAATTALSGCFSALRRAGDALGPIAEEGLDLLGGVPDATVASADDAVSFALERLSNRFGESFSQDAGVAVEEGTHDPNTVYANQRYYRIGLVSDDHPDQPFTSFVRVKPDSTKVASDAECDRPVYFFLDQALQPFRDALDRAQGLAGWAVALDYVRFDTRAWKPDEFDAYMGEGRAASSDPEAVVWLMLPKGGSVEEWATTIHAAEGPVYALKRRTKVLGIPEGQSRRGVVYITDQRYEGADREGVPTEEDALKQLRGWEDFFEDDPWDGVGTGGDPGSADYLPQVQWAPGHGPASW